MAYRLIAIDLDGTLITDEGAILPRVAQAIRRAVQKNVRVVLCTGRTKKGIQRYYDELGLDTLLIVSGGAQVFGANGEAVFSRLVDPPLVKQVLSFADARHIHAQVYLDGELVYREKNKHAAYYEKSYGYPGIVMPDLLALEQINTPKVLFVMDADKVADVQRQAEALFPMLTIKRSNPRYLEFAHPSVNKGEALAFVADYYGISPGDVIAAGDTQIDIPMLQFAGLGVAVANADPEVREAADVLCASNEDGGLADVIEKYILEA